MRSLYFFLFLFISIGTVTETMAGPDCIRVERKTNEIAVDGYTVQLFSFNCKEDVKLYRDETVETAKIIEKSGKVVEEEIGGWRLGKDWFPPNEIKLVDTPDDFPFLVFHSSNYSPANISHSYIMYSTTPTLKKFTELDSPVNEWQVLNRKGSEDVVVGFYKNDKGNYLIDRIVPDDKEAECNSCQGYDLEVLKLTKEGLVVMDKHPYEFEREQKRYQKLQLLNR